jgi:hypothetical protein
LTKKSEDKFEWTEEADIAFAQLKKVLSTPVLVAPKEKEPLLLYIAATHQVVSTVLVVERSKEGKTHGVQRTVYFVSEVLSPTKQRYPHYQKLAYSVFTTTRKLRQYFAVHPIIVVNKAPLSNILNNPSAIGHLFTRVEDDATVAAAVVLFLLPRGRPRPRFSTGASMFKRDSLGSAMRDKRQR